MSFSLSRISTHFQIPLSFVRPLTNPSFQLPTSLHHRTMATINPEEAVTLEVRGRVAIITLNQPKKLNAMNQDLYFRLAQLLNEIAKRDDVFVTLLAGTGRFFSAGADVSISREPPEAEASPERYYLRGFVANNLFVTRAFYTHPKILVTALNGPVVGLTAAIIAFSDFIYAAPHAFFLTPFSSLGLVAEGGASRAVVQRMGVAKAKEALIMSKRISADEMLQTGFVNKIIDAGGDAQKFTDLVLAEVDERLGPHLVQDSLTGIKALLQKHEKDILDLQNVEEVFGGLERFKKGIPQSEFAKIASGAKRHKL